MAHQTYIYWLLDTRPETIAAGWHSGYPFYCGKTIRPAERLKNHVTQGRLRRDRKSLRVQACGEHIRMHIVEIVPPGGRWRERERHWIKILRFSFPDNYNSSDGGDGVDMTPAAIRRRKMMFKKSKRYQLIQYSKAMKEYAERRASEATEMRMRQQLAGWRGRR